MSQRSHRIDIATYYSMHVPAAVLPITAAALLYGFAAMGTIAIVLLTTTAALAVWKRIGRRGRQLNKPQCLWMGLLLALALPPHLLAPRSVQAALPATWPIIPAAGLLLVTLAWLLGPLGSGRVHPVLAAYLTLVILFEPLLAPHYVLKQDHFFSGNLFNAQLSLTTPEAAPWAFPHESQDSAKDALFNPDPAAARLTAYTSGRDQPDRFSVSAEMVLRDKLPPLEDLIVGGEPGPIGLSSALAVIMGGLFLLYRGVIDWRIPLLTVAGAMAAFLILPVPVAITDLGPQWHWLAFRSHYLGWPVALTLANYELLASPLLFVAFFLATGAPSRPMGPGARAAYGIALGLLSAPAQLYGSVAIGPYVALLLVSLASGVLDRAFKPNTLV